MIRRSATLLLGLVGILVLSACRVEVDVDVVVESDGSGVITVTATADAEVLSEVPDLVDDVTVADLAAKGWDLERREPTDDGGLVVVLRQEFADLNELNTALANLGGPFQRVVVERDDSFARTGWALRGTLRLQDGLAGFADAPLIESVRAVPYESALTSRGLTLDRAVTIRFSIRLPGDIAETTGIETRTDDGTVITWTAPLDGSSSPLATLTERRDRVAETADSVASLAQFLFVSWVIVAATFIAWVVFARQRKTRRRRELGYDDDYDDGSYRV